MIMTDTTDALQFEVRRLREIVEKQYLEISWQQSELRTRGGKAKIVRFNADALAKTGLTGNAGLMVDGKDMPPSEFWPHGAVPPRALVPNCGFASYSSSRDELAAIGVNVCGLDEDAVEHVTAMVEERLRRNRNFRPVFLMDITNTVIFRRRGFAYEYFASCSEKEKRFAGRLAAFNAERISFLKRKWGLSGIINFGSRQIEADDQRVTAMVHSRSQRHINTAVDEMVVRAANGRSTTAVRSA
jgi:hypothetical protein